MVVPVYSNRENRERERERHGQEVRRRRDREREREIGGGERWKDEVPTGTLCRHFHESLRRTSGCLVDRFLLARPIASIACSVYQNTHLIMPRVAALASKVAARARAFKNPASIAASSHAASGCNLFPFLTNSDGRR